MIYIEKLNLVFLENPKCATTTIGAALQRYCTINNIDYIRTQIGGLFETPEDITYRHMNFIGLEKFCNSNQIDINKLIIFVSVRDPIDRYVSALFWGKKVITNFENLNNKINENNFINHIYYKNMICFDRFIINEENFKKTNILKLENLQNDYDNFCIKYNLPKLELLKKENKNIYKKNTNINYKIIEKIKNDNTFLYKNNFYK